MKEADQLISKFETFINSEIDSAVKELAKIKVESNRKHLQRLVYVNLTNRFDLLIDALLLKYSVVDGEFKQKVLNETKEEPVFLKEIYEILLSDDPKRAVKQKVEDITQLNFLSLRHSVKLRTLLKLCFNWKDADLDKPRVFVNNGSIYQDTKRQKPYKVPDSVIGYADWLYSRRNALVHHDKSEFLMNDLRIMEKKFGAKPPKSFSIKLSSIKSASKFYLELCKKIKGKKDEEIESLES